MSKDDMRPAALSLILLAAAVAAGPALAKSTDRQQPMDLSAANMDALLSDDSVSTLEGSVTIRQGSLEVDADRAEIHRKAGEIDRIVLTGAPALRCDPFHPVRSPLRPIGQTGQTPQERPYSNSTAPRGAESDARPLPATPEIHGSFP